MTVRLRLFAAARDLVGETEALVELPSGATVKDLRRAAADRYPQLKPLLEHALFAVDAEYADDCTPLGESSDVACIPPVSGG